jgi:RND family efflux transporter MFP subunit
VKKRTQSRSRRHAVSKSSRPRPRPRSRSPAPVRPLPTIPLPPPRKTHHLRNFLLIVCLIALPALAYWAHQHQLIQSQTFTPNFVLVESADLVNTLDASGAVDAKKRANLHFLTGGDVVSLPGLEGASLNKGDLIVSLDRASLQKQLEHSLNNYSMQRLQWDQQLDDIKDRALDQAEQRLVDRNQLILNNSVIDVEITSLSFDDYQMTAPFAGVIVSAPITTANVVISPTDIFEIADPTSLVFKALVDETDMSLIKLGQTATLTFDAYSADVVQLDSYISHIGYKNVSRDANAVYVVELPISEPDLDKFRLGMNGTACITLDTRPHVLKVALENVFLDDDGYFVYVQDEQSSQHLLRRLPDDTLEIITGISKRPIQIGLETEEAYEITSGLKAGETIVSFL